MEALLEALKDPSNMNSQQWLLLAIMMFVLVGSAYFVYRIYRIIETDRKSTYVPNIGRKRLGEKAQNTEDASLDKE